MDERTPLSEVLGRILDPIVALKKSHSALLALFARPDIPESLIGPIASVDQAFAVRVAAVLLARNVDRDEAQLQRVANTMISLFRRVDRPRGNGRYC